MRPSSVVPDPSLPQTISSEKASKTLSYSERLHLLYFKAIKGFIEFTTRHDYRFFGLVLGTMLYETSACLKSAYRIIRHRKEPIHYGFNQFLPEHRGKAPVLLLHGRKGSWGALAQLGKELKVAGIAVFMLNLKNAERCPTENDRAWIGEEIVRIQELYTKTFSEKALKVHLVGHSLGGALSMYTSLTSECSIIDDSDSKVFGDNLKIKEGHKPSPNLLVDKIVTIGMPSNSEEIEWLKQAGKLDSLYNIHAKFDVIVDRECILKTIRPQNVLEVDTGHSGVVDRASGQIIEWFKEKDGCSKAR